MWIIVTKKVFLKIESDCDLRLIDIISDGLMGCFLTAFKINGISDDRSLLLV